MVSYPAPVGQTTEIAIVTVAVASPRKNMCATWLNGRTDADGRSGTLVSYDRNSIDLT